MTVPELIIYINYGLGCHTVQPIKYFKSSELMLMSEGMTLLANTGARLRKVEHWRVWK